MKSNAYFRFKKFAVRHDLCSMKVGTDGVLLGAWANTNNARNILDIGTGSGIIALMMAQRTPDETQIDAVEIERQDADQAKENSLQSSWHSRVKIYHAAIQEFDPQQAYDMIISNPPYFNNSHQPPDKRRHQTRHTVALNYDTLLASVTRLLANDGRLNVVLPYTEGLQFIELASQHGLLCSRRFSLRSRHEKPVERLLLEFSRTVSDIEEGEIVLYSEGLQWGDAYKALTQDFYLAF